MQIDITVRPTETGFELEAQSDEASREVCDRLFEAAEATLREYAQEQELSRRDGVK